MIQIIKKLMALTETEPNPKATNVDFDNIKLAAIQAASGLASIGTESVENTANSIVTGAQNAATEIGSGVVLAAKEIEANKNIADPLAIEEVPPDITEPNLDDSSIDFPKNERNVIVNKENKTIEDELKFGGGGGVSYGTPQVSDFNQMTAFKANGYGNLNYKKFEWNNEGEQAYARISDVKATIGLELTPKGGPTINNTNLLIKSAPKNTGELFLKGNYENIKVTDQSTYSNRDRYGWSSKNLSVGASYISEFGYDKNDAYLFNISTQYTGTFGKSDMRRLNESNDLRDYETNKTSYNVSFANNNGYVPNGVGGTTQINYQTVGLGFNQQFLFNKEIGDPEKSNVILNNIDAEFYANAKYTNGTIPNRESKSLFEANSGVVLSANVKLKNQLLSIALDAGVRYDPSQNLQGTGNITPTFGVNVNYRGEKKQEQQFERF